MLQRVILPFTLSKDENSKAVSEVTFTVQSPRSSFRAVNIAGLRFMKVYEQERYKLSQYQFTQTWDEYKDYLDLQRENISIGNLTRNDLPMGHNRNLELKALDELPHWIEFEMETSSPIDRSSIRLSSQQEYQTNDPKRVKLVADEGKIQSMLLLNTSLTHQDHEGWEGSVSCDMNNLGTFRLRDGGHGNTFTIHASMFDFTRRALSEMPAIQVDLLFR